jgi:hypothetical protein
MVYKVVIKFLGMSAVQNDKYLNDDFLDWEERDESVPLWKHMIAGNYSPPPIISLKAPALVLLSTAACFPSTQSR